MFINLMNEMNVTALIAQEMDALSVEIQNIDCKLHVNRFHGHAIQKKIIGKTNWATSMIYERQLGLGF